MDFHFSSYLLEDAVNELSKLPGVGKRSAMRLALHLLKQEKTHVKRLGESLIKMREEMRFCNKCHNISEKEICNICSNPKRDPSIVCIVEDIRDVLAIENTGQFTGLYHVLGGLISPMDGISPSDLEIRSFLTRIKEENIEEVIFALAATVEGDTTNFYIFKQLKESKIKVSSLARGVAIGDEIEFADEVTLGRSIIQRLPYTGV
ncbi:recombination mediator RecR [Lentimicrobium sp. S6]|uniref:recombination mediator RecR n=1 Tax=Lentimicrobium sp. S6 TaxID=2735872 RepID=UPI001554751F|nr:recombination mediator RecR [Lentimicrobium sp. S6]NPD45826.1 recombination protein RecR [Lentimicrobium sp. S6]